MRELARSRAKTLDCGQKGLLGCLRGQSLPIRQTRLTIADSPRNEFESASKHASGNNDQDKEGHTLSSRMLKYSSCCTSSAFLINNPAGNRLRIGGLPGALETSEVW